jgi:hypothetical protein
MGKLKQYEIEAIISAIHDQILDTNKNNRRDEFAPAETKLSKLIKQEKEAYAIASKLTEKRRNLSNELSNELDAYYCNVKEKFQPRQNINRLEIRNKLILSQISPDANIDQIIKDIVKTYTK